MEAAARLFDDQAAARAMAASWRQVRHDLRQASQDHAFTLLFQPRFELKSGAVCGVQAQLRWPRRRGGRAPAGAFVPLLQECGVADDVAAWSLAAACRAAVAWPGLPVCLAVPGASLHDGRLLSQVGAALAASELPPEQLQLELSEVAFAGEDDDALLALAALRDSGVCIALDEFGSASACLLTLKRLPLTAVKLDRSLVRDLPGDRDAASVAAAAIGLAHALGVAAVASGLETEAQRSALRRMGCDQAQGALCGRQMTEAAFLEYLDDDDRREVKRAHADPISFF
jgi:EAL domain-containing protein (putative c-di-GMP-specific phosphodiesterase class I)